ncbi:cytochrome C oxidase subunit II [Evansella sp. AB-P1]|uniref:cytochrome C oxidase subunit II n=1 Tax=Evansella sp. AB-P1 TaxID=3037653 RepID=UPI00241CD909|nr:cytochrome C oxidase subunit II [Evansella sp. AB-P1]MDG5785878.1 cytochrome C oxidase subunit II [Evansella sp. AB-P1]
MKKLLTLMLSATILVSLAACGNDGEAEANTAELEEITVDKEVEAGDKEFTITATNFDFTIDEELVVKKGDNVTIHIVNEEGVHGLEIPGFNVTGGLEETIQFEATETGTFEILCSIPCGDGHHDMSINLVVVD